MEEKLLNDYLNEDIKSSNVSKYFTKILLCLIVFFSCLIYSKSSVSNQNKIEKYLFEENFDFMKFKKYYTKFAGEVKKEQTKTVFGQSLEIINLEKYLDGQKIILASQSPISTFGSGIVVFSGQKENYGNTVIIQGSNGYDIWYGNLENIDVAMYDYVDENSIIGLCNSELYLVITKDGKYFTYEEYKNQI